MESTLSFKSPYTALSLIQGKRCEIEEPLLVTANEQYTQLNN